ncbi:MAG: AAA family ATPase [Deltaproteobacteria bacterium]|nr:AAA family ATPase [Deltaproteobacteria bacterium]
MGKSLLVDTLDNILRGRRELFEGLWIDHSNYDWWPCPVIRLSLASLNPESFDTVKSSLIQP